jgi:hypothetical protein
VKANRELILDKAEHLERMVGYLPCSLEQVQRFIPIATWESPTPEQHESLAAFRVRFSDFQEQFGKAMRAIAIAIAIAIEEEEIAEPFDAVPAFMEKLRILDSPKHRKLIRESRNAINSEYEDASKRLSEFFERLTLETPAVHGYAQALLAFVDRH